jgi:hypothetical protein
MKITDDPTLAPLNRLLGTWITEATHPAMPGLVVHGTASVEWLEGERFLIVRSRTDHPDFPDAISIIGDMERDRVDEKGEAPSGGEASSWGMHYFDSRGVFRAYETNVADDAWHWWREVAGFSQRFTGRFADGGNTIIGLSQLRRDDVHWADDLAITYRRREGA